MKVQVDVPRRTVSCLIEFTLRLLGVWPESRYRIFIYTAWTVSFITAQILQYWYIIVNFTVVDLVRLMDSLATTFSYTLVFLKVVIFWSKRRTFFNIYSDMSIDWKECTISEWNAHAMANAGDLSHRFSKSIVTAYLTSATIYAGSAILHQPGERELLLNMQIPFNTSASPTYELIVAGQLCQQLSFVYAESMLNAILVTLVLHADGQISIIRHDLFGMTPKGALTARSDSVLSLIQKHQRVIAFSDNIEDLFCYIALIHFLANIVVLCVLGFTIVISVNAGDGGAAFLKFFPYYAAINLGAFILCFAGEYLASRSKSVGNAAYESVWYDLQPSVQRVLLLLILRSQRRLTITVGKFMDLSLECLAMMLKASASYISVLHAMC